MKPTVLLADDHTLMLDGLRRLLTADYEIVGAVEDGRALVEAARRLRPDVVLLDVSMPLLNGIEAGRRIKKATPESKLVFVTMHADPTYATEAFRAGASAYLLKRCAASELCQAIRAVLQGHTYLSPIIAGDVLDPLLQSRPERSGPGRLTPRQREVLQPVAEGRTAKEIAALLGVSVKTVEYHKALIMNQLGLRTVAELTKYAIAQGLISL